jgi:hypothetical protein
MFLLKGLLLFDDVGPNITTPFDPDAAAKCDKPPSLPTNPMLFLKI